MLGPSEVRSIAISSATKNTKCGLPTLSAIGPLNGPQPIGTGLVGMA